MIYDEHKMYGPYKRKDNRSHVVLVFKDGSKKTVSFPRYKVEMGIGKLLEPNQDVHHIDGNVENNEFSNLEIVNKSDHIRQHTNTVNFNSLVTCIICKKQFRKTAKQMSYTRGNESEYYCCSKSCSGKLGKYFQMNPGMAK